MANVKKIHIGIIPDGNRRWCKENQHNINYLNQLKFQHLLSGINLYYK